MKMLVKVWETDVELTLSQRSPSVWIAYGSYLGRSFDVKGRSPSAAANLWADAARYKTG
jgi:hypothetical protein